MRDTFRDFTRSTKILIWVMLACGLALFTVCLIADLLGAHWMETYAYIPNILAGLTGFLIGVPFALVVFATLASQRDEKSAADRVNAISQIAWDQYREAITALCSPQRVDAMTVCAQRIQDVHDETWHLFNTDIARQSPEEFELMVASADQQSHLWSQAIQNLMQQVGQFSDLRLQWFAAVRDWNTLDQYIRLQRLERGLHWFHRELDSLLQESMVSDRHPMRAFFEMHDGEYGHAPDEPDDMVSAWRRVDSLIHVGHSQDTFNRFAREASGHFPTTRVDGYLHDVGVVTHQMGMLYAFVQQIDRSGWPTNGPEDPPLAS